MSAPATSATPKRKDRLPPKYERLSEALFQGIRAAAAAPAGAVNLADYLDAAQIRMIGRLSAKDGLTPRQWLQAFVRRVTAGVRNQTTSATAHP